MNHGLYEQSSESRSMTETKAVTESFVPIYLNERLFQNGTIFTEISITRKI